MKKTKNKKSLNRVPKYLKTLENNLESVAENASWAQLACKDLPDLMNKITGFTKQLNIQECEEGDVEWNEMLPSDAYTWLSNSHYFVETAQRAILTATMLASHLTNACNHARTALETSEKLLKSERVI